MNNNTETRKIVIDPGFLGFKMAEMINGNCVLNELPTVTGIGEIPDMGILSTGLGRVSKAIKPIQVDLGDQSILVGHNVHQYTKPTTRLDYERLREGPEIRALVYAILSNQLNGNDCMSLLIGLPVSVMSDKNLAQKTMSKLRSWMVGNHEFTVNTNPYHIRIEKVRGMAQPLGTYWCFGLDKNGQWDRGSADWDAPVVIADIGFNTLDAFGIQKGQLIHRATGGERLGMHQAARAIIEEVSKWGVRPSLYEMDLMIKAHTSGEEVLLYHPNGTETINNLIETALSQAFSSIAEFIDARLNGLPYRFLIITGGGAMALKKWLLEHYPYAIILDDPVTANARGLARYAIREGVF